MIAKRAKQPTVTQRDIADLCDLSVMTVSMALREKCDSLRPETVARVREAALELGYNPAQTLAARRLRYGAEEPNLINQLVGLYFSLRHAHGTYFTQLLQGIGDVFDQAGFSLLSNWTPMDRVLPSKLPTIFGRGEVDGVLTLSGIPHIESIVTMLRAEPGFGHRPIVCIMEAQEDCSCVLVDDVGGGHALMSHLLDLGHRELLCVTFDRWQHRQRVKGCRQACLDRGLDPDAAVHLMPYWTEEPERSREMLRTMLAQHPGCRAIFGANDMTACLLAGWLEADGFRLPHDISLIGFDDTHTLPGPDGGNLLTTVRLPLEEIGRRSAELLLKKIRADHFSDETLHMPVELVLRGSTAPPA